MRCARHARHALAGVAATDAKETIGEPGGREAQEHQRQPEATVDFIREMALACCTSYVVEARRSVAAWEERLRARLAAEASG